jgi:hypothetical protein
MSTSQTPVEDLVSNKELDEKSEGSESVSRESAEPPKDEETSPPEPAAKPEVNNSDSSDPARPPLPDEEAPPLPDEPPPDDGWEPVWDATAQTYYFYNHLTQETQWDNPRVSQAAPASLAVGAAEGSVSSDGKRKRGAAGGYNPAIHGDYDPNAEYAQPDEDEDDEVYGSAAGDGPAEGSSAYAATGHFNRFTGRWQDESINPELHNDDNKSKRQLNAYFDVDAAANIHDGRSLKAERQNKRLSGKEIKAFKDKRRQKKEEKRRAWLRD